MNKQLYIITADDMNSITSKINKRIQRKENRLKTKCTKWLNRHIKQCIRRGTTSLEITFKDYDEYSITKNLLNNSPYKYADYSPAHWDEYKIEVRLLHTEVQE